MTLSSSARTRVRLIVGCARADLLDGRLEKKTRHGSMARGAALHVTWYHLGRRPMKPLEREPN
jgi:hypothetical protein